MQKSRINVYRPLFLIFVLIAFSPIYAGITLKKEPVVSTRIESNIFLPLPPIDINTSPTIDGNGDDVAWAGIPGYVVTIKQADKKIKIVIKTLKTKDRIFFLIKAPLKSFIKQHKLWHWDREKKIYLPGDEKETSLTLHLYKDANLAASADVWIWRAARNNIAGFADDMFLTNSSYTMDRGTNCWYSRFFGEFAGATLPRFYQRTPKGSAADVKAKGTFDNSLTVEFSRKLTTNHKDDIDLSGKFFMKLILE